MGDNAASKSTVLSRWRERRWKKAQRRREIQERQAESETANAARLQAETEGTWVDRVGNLGGGGHP